MLTFIRHSIASGFMNEFQWDLIDTDRDADSLLKRLVTAAGFPAPARLDAI